MHEELDKKIVAAVRSGKNRFADIQETVKSDYRTVDRRLQALKKQGKLKFGKGKTGWTA